MSVGKGAVGKWAVGKSAYVVPAHKTTALVIPRKTYSQPQSAALTALTDTRDSIFNAASHNLAPVLAAASAGAGGVGAIATAAGGYINGGRQYRAVVGTTWIFTFTYMGTVYQSLFGTWDTGTQYMESLYINYGNAAADIGKFSLILRGSNGVQLTSYSTADQFVVGNEYTVAIRMKSTTTVEAAINGVPISMSYYVSGPYVAEAGLADYALDYCNVNERGTHGTGLTSAAKLHSVVRLFSNTQSVADLSANPWQLFKKEPTRTYFEAHTANTYVPKSTALILPRRFTQQPQGETQIDRLNPITRDAAFIWNPSVGTFNPTVGLLTFNFGGTRVVEGSTVSTYFASSEYITGPANTAQILTSDGVGTGDFTLIISDKSPAFNGGRALVSQRSNATALNQVSLLANSNASFTTTSGSLHFATHSSASTNFAVAGLVDGLTHTRALVRSGTVLTGYQDGAVVGSVDGTVRNVVASDSKLGIGIAPPTYNTASTMTVRYVYAFNRALSADEIKEIHLNPWQIFKRDPQRIYFDASTSSFPTLSSLNASILTASGARLTVN